LECGWLESHFRRNGAGLCDPDLDANSDGNQANGTRCGHRQWPDCSAGRFGWKAAEPNVHQQSMGAFAGDMALPHH